MNTRITESGSLKIISVARKHAAKGDMTSSAASCVDDALRCLQLGMFEAAAQWATRSLSYSVGVFHDDYKKAKEVVG